MRRNKAKVALVHMSMGKLKDSIAISHKLLLCSLKNDLSRMRFTLHKLSFIPRVNWPCPFTTWAPNALNTHLGTNMNLYCCCGQVFLQVGTPAEPVDHLQNNGITFGNI